MTTGKIILEQIKAIDPMAIFAWGTTNLKNIQENEDTLGGLSFNIQNNPNIPEVATVEIILNGSDLYDVRIFTGDKTYFHDKDFFFGDLVVLIDGVVG